MTFWFIYHWWDKTKIWMLQGWFNIVKELKMSLCAATKEPNKTLQVEISVLWAWRPPVKTLADNDSLLQPTLQLVFRWMGHQAVMCICTFREWHSWEMPQDCKKVLYNKENRFYCYNIFYPQLFLTIYTSVKSGWSALMRKLYLLVITGKHWANWGTLCE